MTTKNYKTTRLSKEEARKRIVKIALDGAVLLSAHCRDRMRERDIILNDILNVLLSTSMRVSEGEPHGGGFTYKCSTKKFSVAMGFTVRGDGVVVVTVFRVERSE